MKPEEIDEKGSRMLAQFRQALQRWASSTERKGVQDALSRLAIEVDDALIAVMRAREGL